MSSNYGDEKVLLDLNEGKEEYISISELEKRTKSSSYKEGDCMMEISLLFPLYDSPVGSRIGWVHGGQYPIIGCEKKYIAIDGKSKGIEWDDSSKAIKNPYVEYDKDVRILSKGNAKSTSSSKSSTSSIGSIKFTEKDITNPEGIKISTKYAGYEAFGILSKGTIYLEIKGKIGPEIFNMLKSMNFNVQTDKAMKGPYATDLDMYDENYDESVYIEEIKSDLAQILTEAKGAPKTSEGVSISAKGNGYILSKDTEGYKISASVYDGNINYQVSWEDDGNVNVDSFLEKQGFSVFANGAVFKATSAFDPTTPKAGTKVASSFIFKLSDGITSELKKDSNYEHKGFKIVINNSSTQATVTYSAEGYDLKGVMKDKKFNVEIKGKFNQAQVKALSDRGFTVKSGKATREVSVNYGKTLSPAVVKGYDNYYYKPFYRDLLANVGKEDSVSTSTPDDGGNAPAVKTKAPEKNKMPGEYSSDLKDIEAYVKKVAADVDLDPKMTITYLEEANELSEFKMPTVGIALVCTDLRRTKPTLKQDPLVKKFNSSKTLKRFTDWRKGKLEDLHNKEVWFSIYIHAGNARKNNIKALREGIEGLIKIGYLDEDGSLVNEPGVGAIVESGYDYGVVSDIDGAVAKVIDDSGEEYSVLESSLYLVEGISYLEDCYEISCGDLLDYKGNQLVVIDVCEGILVSDIHDNVYALDEEACKVIFK